MKVLLLSIVVFFAGFSGAYAGSYLCSFSPNYGGWVPPLFQIFFSDASRKATLYDLSRPENKGVSVRVRKTKDNAEIIGFRLVRHNVRNSSGQHSTALRYHMTIKKETGEAHVDMKPQGYSNRLRAKGACKPVNGLV